MTETIYMPLLDEGISVWRPVPAHRVTEDTFIVLRPHDYDDQDERWKFPPGSVVTAGQRQGRDGAILAAVALVTDVRQTA